MNLRNLVKWLLIGLVGGAIVSVVCFVESDISIDGISINQYIGSDVNY